MDQNRMIAELKARGYDEDTLNSYGIAQLNELHKKEFPDKYVVADNAVQNQDFSKDKDYNAALYKMGNGPGIFKPAARRNFEGLEADSAAKRAAEGNNDPTTKGDADKWGFEKAKDGLANLGVGGTPVAGNAPTLDVPSPSPNMENKTPNAGIGNLAGNNPGSTSGSDNSDNVTEAAANDPRTNYQLKGIWQAFKDGDIDKSTAQYMAMDVIGNFARDLAKGQANIAAIYNGGAPSEVGNTQSLWDKRNAEMAKQGISAEAATVKGSDKNYERLFQDKNLTSLGLDNEFKAMKNYTPRQLVNIANDPKQPDAMRKAAMIMVANATGEDMGWEEYAALLGGGAIDNLKQNGLMDTVKSVFFGK